MPRCRPFCFSFCFRSYCCCGPDSCCSSCCTDPNGCCSRCCSYLNEWIWCCRSRDESPIVEPINRVSTDLFIVVAIYDFTKIHPEDLSFNRGDRMSVLDNDDVNWWKARHNENGEVGLIPTTHVRRLEPYPENHEAWSVVNRREAINLLSHSGCGTFLIRPYVKDDAYCAISLAHLDPTQTTLIVRHFKVHREEDGQFRFCPKLCDKNFFILVEKHKAPVDCDCGIVLRKHCVEKPSSCPRHISRESLVKQRTLGNGFFGEVWLGKMESTEVAVKQLKSDRLENQNMMVQELMEEAQRLCLIKHRYIVQLLGVCLENGPILLVMEYVALGALNKFLSNDAGKNIDFSRLCIMMSMVADGMDYIETELHMVHRDLRGANVLVERDYAVKIADFGLARDAEYIPSNFQLPVRWTAPEAFTSDGHSSKADVWSFGVLAYEAFTYGSVPYADMSKAEVRTAVSDGYRLPNPHGRRIYGGSNHVNCPETIYSTMLQCWSKDPLQRPTFVYLNSFFTDIISVCDLQYIQIEDVC